MDIFKPKYTVTEMLQVKINKGLNFYERINVVTQRVKLGL